MELLKAIILGLIQGVAEFLPISSSGHLAIFKYVLKFETETGLLFDVLLHLGTLAAVFVVFWKDIWQLIKEGCAIIGQFFKSMFGKLFGKKKWEPVVTTPYRRFVMMVIISTIPTGIMGILLSDLIDAASATLIVPGILLLLMKLKEENFFICQKKFRMIIINMYLNLIYIQKKMKSHHKSQLFRLINILHCIRMF